MVYLAIFSATSMHSHHSTFANEHSLYPTLPLPLLTLLVGLAVCTLTRDPGSGDGINDILGGGQKTLRAEHRALRSIRE